jgi:hypothetical protein
LKEQIKNAAPKNEKPPPPQKQRSWTPHAVEQEGHLDSEHYNKYVVIGITKDLLSLTNSLAFLSKTNNDEKRIQRSKFQVLVF